MGSVLAAASTLIINPLLYNSGILTTWSPQMQAIDTNYSNFIDFYFSFGIGQTMAIVVISVLQIVVPIFMARKLKPVNAADTGAVQPGSWRNLLVDSPKRGDFSIFIAASIYLFTAAFWICLSSWLVPGFPWQFFAAYAIIYTPLISYATAKLEGIAGQAVSIPYIREATFILSGYQGVAIWFAPASVPNYGVATVGFRVMELTGTKILSQIKAIIVTLPIIVVASLLFSQLLWGMAEIPSSNYPHAQMMWELEAKKQGIMMTSTTEGGSIFQEAWKWKYFGWGIGTGLASFTLLSALGLPTLLTYGIVRGLGQSMPAYALLEFAGAMIGGFYFRKKFGEKWFSYTPVLAAGFACGMGLISLIAVAVNILSSMISPLRY
jgi:hypothetical protein